MESRFRRQVNAEVGANDERARLEQAQRELDAQALAAEQARKREASSKVWKEIFGTIVAVIVVVFAWQIHSGKTPDPNSAPPAPTSKATPSLSPGGVESRSASGAKSAGGFAALQAADQTHRSGTRTHRLTPAGAQPEATRVVDEPPRFASFMQTVRSGTGKDVEWMVRNGADANMRIEGTTPLLEAVKLSNVEAAMVLLSAGADPNRTDRDGQTALYYARQNHADAIVELLLAHGAVGAR